MPSTITKLAVLTCTAPTLANNAASAALAFAAAIPTLSDYALLALALMFGALAAMKLR